MTGEQLMRTEGIGVTQHQHDSAGRLVAVELLDDRSHPDRVPSRRERR